jgi:hypothetical protein
VAERIISLECKLGTEKADLGWEFKQQLDSIEFHLFSDKHVKCCDLMDAFSVSMRQAFADPTSCIRTTLNNMAYDKRARIHIGRTEFEPLFRKPESTARLSQCCSIVDDTLDWADSRMVSSRSCEAVPTLFYSFCAMTLPLGLDADPSARPPYEQQIVLLHKDRAVR